MNNRVADALSRRERTEEVEKGEVLAVSELIPQWVLDIQSSYEGDE